MSTFVDIYTHHVIPGREKDFQKIWHQIADFFVNQDTAKAATLLHRKDDNTFLSITRWPDKASADAGWSPERSAWKEIPDEIYQALKAYKTCIDHTKKQPRMSADAIDSVYKD